MKLLKGKIMVATLNRLCFNGLNNQKDSTIEGPGEPASFMATEPRPKGSQLPIANPSLCSFGVHIWALVLTYLSQLNGSTDKKSEGQKERI